jgi:hypothetical protein
LYSQIACPTLVLWAAAAGIPLAERLVEFLA